ncbi:MAG: 2,3-bisphosphoglycerate-independent phosphoglycerate mutase, partial [Chitinophagaceae bacterium]|nr:2,3-bisphosphoglycerate-independent phosphoglycerate mutase [Chitinophagaceae bacterium]
MNKKIILVIMDGWGLGKITSADAIQQANVPFVSSLYKQYPNTTLITCGEEVGLPDGQMGNSEVGHLNLGAGRIVYQELQRINVAVKTGELANNSTFLSALSYAKNNKKALHLIGLVSDGGVHSHINHLKAICDLCQNHDLSKVFIHVFTDGRDTDPKSGLGFVKELETHLQHTVGKIASVSGRYYAMDRDKRWERVKLTYDCLVHAKGPRTTSAVHAIDQALSNGTTAGLFLPT